jgi:hypothetical protein
MDEAEVEGQLRLRRLIVEPARAPEAVHHFIWARLGGEFLLEVGHVDLLEAHNRVQAVKSGTTPDPLDLIIIHRFSLSPESLVRLGEAVNAMLSSLKEVKLDVTPS